jgi:hypothetical protein
MEFPGLHKLFSKYLGTNWNVKYLEYVAAVEAFRVNEDRALVSNAYQNLAEMLTEYEEEELLADIVIKDLGCQYNPHEDGMDYKTWLAIIAKQLETGFEYDIGEDSDW